MVLGPNFKPFKYFCASNVRVRTQGGDLNTCAVEASMIILASICFSLLWFCLIIERITIEILQKPSMLEATPNIRRKSSILFEKIFRDLLFFSTGEETNEDAQFILVV